VPPVTLVGLRLNEERVTGVAVWVTVSTAEVVSPPEAPQMSTLIAAFLGRVDTMKSALVTPAATVTLGGTVATDVLLLPSATTAPPAGAAAFRVTVPVEGLPPSTLVGFRLTEEIWDHVIRPVGFQLTPLFVLLYTPLVPVPAYRMVGIRGSIARVRTVPTPVRPVAFQLAPPSVLLYTPLVPVPAYRTVGVRGSIARAATPPTPVRPVAFQLVPPSELWYPAPSVPA